MPRPKKPRIGRPPRAGKTSDERVEIRITKAERARWSLAASRESLTLGEWLRQAAELAIARGSTR